MDTITWSHSRLNTILDNPAEYYWKYIKGVYPIVEKPALALGSAVHWGLEHNTDDLTEYYNKDEYTEEQLLAEAMIGAYFRRAEEIRGAMLLDGDSLVKVEDEFHELTLECDIPSNVYRHKTHHFLGIVDLLFLTEKGWVLVDYKTSSRDVDWNQYKSQLFKYKLLLEKNFPETPLFRVAIINIKKTGIRKKKTENDDAFRMRLKETYMVDDSLIDYHIYDASEFDENSLSDYVENLSGLIDIAEDIIEKKNWACNYSAITGLYGESEYAKIFYHDPNAYVFYKIRDKVYDEDSDEMVEERPCCPSDFERNAVCQYKDFEEIVKSWCIGKKADRDKLLSRFSTEYPKTDKGLLEKYFVTFEKSQK